MVISFCFSGWVNKFPIRRVMMVETGEWIELYKDNVYVGFPKDELEQLLEKGTLCISLSDVLEQSDNCEVDLDNYVVH